MRKRKIRIGAWFIIVMALAATAIYFYVSKSNTSLSTSNTAGVENTKLIYLLQNGSKQSLVRRQLIDQSENILMTEEKLGQFVSIIPSDQVDEAYLLNITEGKYLFGLVNLKSGELTNLADLTEFKPSAIYPLNNVTFGLVTNSNKNITIIDNQFNKVNEFTSKNDITFCLVDPDNRIEYADFDGTSSTINLINSSDNTRKEIQKVDGKIYSFNYIDGNRKVLYAKRINIKDQNPNNPSGSTYWKIATYDSATNRETLISDGNFDQNAVSNQDFTLFSYQKKFDTLDQADGRIFIVDAKSGIDRINAGIPVIFDN